MISAIDKALIPILVSAATWLNQKYGLHLDVDPASLAMLVGAASSIIVYFIPNKAVPK